MADKLARIVELDQRPLTESRPPEKRVVGNCRDFSVLLTAMLRHQGNNLTRAAHAPPPKAKGPKPT